MSTNKIIKEILYSILFFLTIPTKKPSIEIINMNNIGAPIKLNDILHSPFYVKYSSHLTMLFRLIKRYSYLPVFI